MSVSASNASSTEADVDDRGKLLEESGSGLKFHLEVLAFQPTFYDIGNTCSEAEAGVTPITVEVTGDWLSLMKTNETLCQVTGTDF